MILHKGDRIERIPDWGPDGPIHGLTKKTGTVWEDGYEGQEEIKWRVDGYPYGPTNYHITKVRDIRILGDAPATGMNCKTCNNPNPWAKPNQADGRTYICFECRN